MVSDTARQVLDAWSAGCPVPAERGVRRDYCPVETYDDDGAPWPGVVTGWSTLSDGVELCRLRLAHAGAPRWVVYHPDRIEVLVSGGT
ncbi:MAG: hypothetical protein HOV66_07210 [Streptomycetaceae bacterium]|nr:hypothetical protein [Streptomycetaceae bacterium]